jgi:2-phosphosulfolactate phosphatase
VSAVTPAVRLLVTPAGLQELDTKKDVCIVIDVLRACTTIAHALAAGAQGIIPVETVEEAMRLAATLDKESTLLCGERESVRIEGFDLGNSPLEYTPDVVGGKTLVFSSTNGARALVGVAGAKECLAASFLTLRAAAQRAAGAGNITIICAGSGAFFSLEDFLCAGMLVDQIAGLSEENVALDDGARAALETARHLGRDLLETVQATDHGRNLARLGFADDIVLACEVDRFPFVPALRDGRIAAEPAAATPRAR